MGLQCSKGLVGRGAGSCPQAGHCHTVVPGASTCVLVAGCFEAGLPRLCRRLRLRCCRSPAPASRLHRSSGLPGSGSALLELGKAAALSPPFPATAGRAQAAPARLIPPAERQEEPKHSPGQSRKRGSCVSPDPSPARGQHSGAALFHLLHPPPPPLLFLMVGDGARIQANTGV